MEPSGLYYEKSSVLIVLGDSVFIMLMRAVYFVNKVVFETYLTWIVLRVK